MKKRFLVSGLMLLLSAGSVQSQQVNDFEVINALMDSVLNTRLCHYYFGNLKKEQFGADTAQWNEYVTRVITSEEEYHSIPKLLNVSDSLTALRTPKYLDKMLFDIRIDESFRDLIASYDTVIAAQLIPDSKSIVVSGAECLTREDTFFQNRESKFGKVDGVLYLGIIQCSRVHYDASRNLGFYFFGYLGQSLCGYTCYVFFSRAGEQWVFEGVWETGVF